MPHVHPRCAKEALTHSVHGDAGFLPQKKKEGVRRLTLLRITRISPFVLRLPMGSPN